MSDKPCTSAATFTSNRIKAAPVQVSMEHLKLGDIRGVVLNSGNANACTGRQGIVDARAMASAAAARVGLKPEQFLVCSTGRIGVGLPVKRIEAGICRHSCFAAWQSGLRAGDHDQRHLSQRIGIFRPSRGGSFSYRRHREGCGNDQPQHGHDALRDNHRCVLPPTRVAGRSSRRGRKFLQSHYDRRRHEHERHGHSARQRRLRSLAVRFPSFRRRWI